MNAPESFVQIIDRTRYSIADAELIASDEYWNGNNWEQNGRNQFLYRGKNGGYFLLTMTLWQGEMNGITPLSEEEAADYYESQLFERYLSYEEAFPGIEVKDA